MSRISFIVTTYNIAPYIERCLESLAALARPGDEVIVVDDGSSDGTDALLRAFVERGSFAENVTFKPVYLGTNTIGGVGIGANIGLSEATRDTVFFVDGDDWMDPDGFNQARTYWTVHDFDIMFTNYLEYDQKSEEFKKPADWQRWQVLDPTASFDIVQESALALIAVPWRKFYRRAFLDQHDIRFPEGDFFFEDNPFHWDVCLKAQEIGFLNKVTCYHRVNRPGQTMASTGVELAAFFTHFETILSKIPEDCRRLEGAISRWLLNNMTWHLERLAEPAYYSYALQAGRALARIRQNVWEEDLGPTETRKQIWPVANRLRDGDIWGQVDDWRCRDLSRRLDELDRTSEVAKQTQAMLQGHRAAVSFEVIAEKHRTWRTMPDE